MLRGCRACRTCYENAKIMEAIIRPSRHVKMVWRVANMSETSRACRARGIWRMTRQTDKLAKKINNYHGVEFPELFLERTCSLWQADWGNTRKMLRGCHEDVTRKLLSWNLALKDDLLPNAAHSTREPKNSRRNSEHYMQRGTACLWDNTILRLYVSRRKPLDLVLAAIKRSTSAFFSDEHSVNV